VAASLRRQGLAGAVGARLPHNRELAVEAALWMHGRAWPHIRPNCRQSSASRGDEHYKQPPWPAHITSL
jgi:hypothetical protein